MKHLGRTYLLLCLLAFVYATPANGQRADQIAPLLDGLGDHHHAVTTDSERAQRFFDQGLILAWAFNHAEAERSFREAARLDSACAMCYWGIALVLGPNINAAMDPDDAPEAYAALQKARELAPGATEREQAYIDALAKRYAEAPPEDRSALDRAYAEAMGDLARRYPDDLDAATLYGEALMDTTPWDYWKANGDPKEVTEEILAVFEAVLERDPQHPGANHLYIHAVEAVHPEKGIPMAERLEDLVPGAGHLVHMPSHIYIRVGRYHDAVLANERAVAADRAYVTQCHAQGLYPLAYVPHNHHFLWYSATMAGERDVAIRAARQVAAHTDTEMMHEPGYGTLQHYWSIPLYAYVRFGAWDEILEEPAPAEDLLYPRGVWHYARGMALVRTGQPEQAADELDRLRSIATDPNLETTIWDLNTTAHLLKIAAEVLAGELAAARGRGDDAIRHLERGVALEDDLNYDEPPPWHAPVRQTLGAVLLEADRPAEAERVYRKDLERFPENGWSLFGLAESLRAQDETAAAEDVQARFEEAWQHADITLNASRF